MKSSSFRDRNLSKVPYCHEEVRNHYVDRRLLDNEQYGEISILHRFIAREQPKWQFLPQNLQPNDICGIGDAYHQNDPLAPGRNCRPSLKRKGIRRARYEGRCLTRRKSITRSYCSTLRLACRGQIPMGPKQQPDRQRRSATELSTLPFPFSSFADRGS